MYHANTDYKKAGVAVLILDKVDFTAKDRDRDISY